MSDVIAIVSNSERRVVEGDIYSSDDPIVQVNPSWFAAVEKRVEKKVPVVETATAAPGEVRATRSSSGS